MTKEQYLFKIVKRVYNFLDVKIDQKATEDIADLVMLEFLDYEEPKITVDEWVEIGKNNNYN